MALDVPDTGKRGMLDLWMALAHKADLPVARRALRQVGQVRPRHLLDMLREVAHDRDTLKHPELLQTLPEAVLADLLGSAEQAEGRQLIQRLLGTRQEEHDV